MQPLHLVPTVFLLIVATGCSGDPSPAKAAPDSPTGDDTAPPPFDPTTDCETLGMPSVPFVEATASPLLYDVAGDITLETTDGPWTLSANWSGCDVYLFVSDEPAQNQGAPDPTWGTKKDNKALIDAMPMNTHVFFLSSQNDENRLIALEDLKNHIDAQLDDYDEETRAWKERHIHYVTDKDKQADSWLGETFDSPGWGVGIDRTQRIRYIGSMGDPDRYNSSYGWFEPNLSMIANEARYYNFEALRETRLDAQGATLVPTWTGETISGTVYVDFELPDAATMATFDSMEWDMTMLCVGDGEYTECPSWDYLTYAWLCDVEDPETCTQEVGRWITTYHREGRWVHDVSPLLALLKDGGSRRLAFYSQNTYEMTLTLRLFNQGGTDTPDEAQVLYTGGYISSTWNEREPLTVDIPADVSRVGLGVVMSGHGQTGTPACMEFCGSEHNFTVNGHDNLFTYAIEDSTFGCMNQVDEGTVPNQYGTWWYGRNGWCPGKQVDMDVVDISDQVLLGETNTFNYEIANLNGTLDGGGDIVLTTWLVYYR